MVLPPVLPVMYCNNTSQEQRHLLKYGCNRSLDQRGSRHTSAGLPAQQQALALWDRACPSLGAVRRGLGAGTEGLQAHCSAGQCPGSIPVPELLAAPSVVSLPGVGNALRVSRPSP